MAVDYQIGAQGANYRNWLKIVRTTDAQGNTVQTTNLAYVELASGLNYRGANGQWQPSREEIDVYPGGAIAQYGQHKVIFGNNLNAVGVVDQQMPDGQEMKSGVLGLAYFDPASGKSVLIAQVQHSQGQIVSSNEVLYPDAFQGVKASVLYKYTLAGLEQDVVLQEQPPSPESFGLSSAACVLQVLTEFTSNPPPLIRAQHGAANDVLSDEMLDFGAMKMIHGRAFMLGTNAPPAPIAKHWLNVNGRRVLMESVPLKTITNSLEKLPGFAGANLNPTNGSPLYAVSVKRLLPAPTTARANKATMQFAGTSRPARGFVLDYIIVNSSSDPYTFQGDTTYYVSGPANFTSDVTFEGGSVIKYAPMPAGASVNVYDPGQINCEGTEYRPTIFTAKDDDRVGQSISESSGQPAGTYANPAIGFNGSASGASELRLHDFHISYAQEAIYAIGASLQATVTDGQIVHCTAGFYTPGQTTADFNNVLFSHSQPAFYLANAAVYGRNLTFDQAGSHAPLLAAIGSVPPTLSLENCILANVYLYSYPTPMITGDHNGFYNSGAGSISQYGATTFGSHPTTAQQDPFYGVGGGNYYLLDSSPFATAGTLDAHCSAKTTTAPILVNWPLSTPNTIFPRELADTVGALGYHYPILDYVFDNVNLSATLTMQSGVRIGLLGGSYGCAINPETGANIVCVGEPQAMNRIVSCQNVQEAVNDGGNAFLLLNGGADGQKSFQFRFTEFSIAQGEAGSMFLSGYGMGPFKSISIQDCVLRSTYVGGNAIPSYGIETIGMTNNLLQRCEVNVAYTYANNGNWFLDVFCG